MTWLGRTRSERRKNARAIADEVPRGKGASAAKGRDDAAREMLARKVILEDRRKILAMGGLTVGAGALGLLAGRATAPLGDAQSGAHISLNDVVAKRIGGVRYATEFDAAKHTGLAGDPWTGTAISAAHTDLPVAGGRIELPLGQTTLASGLTFTKPVHLAGVGRAATIINGGSQNALTIGADDSILTDFQVIMPTVSSGHGIVIDGPEEFHLRNLEIRGVDPTHYSIRCLGNFLWSIDHVYLFTNGSGLYIFGPSDIVYGDATVRGLFVNMRDNTDAGTYGLHIQGRVNLINFDGIEVTSSIANPNAMTGIQIDQSHNLLFANVSVQGPDTSVNSINGANNNAWLKPYLGRTMLFGSRDVIYGPGVMDGTVTGIATLFRHPRVIHADTMTLMPITDKRYHSEFYDDFLGNAVNPFWRQATGSWALQSGLRGGQIRGTTGATPADTAILDGGPNPAYARVDGILFECIARRVDVAAQDVHFGMTNGGVTSSNHGAWIECLTSDTNFFAASADGAAIGRSDTGVARNTVLRHFHIKLNEVTNQIDYFINNTKVATRTSNLPGSSTIIGPHLQVTTQTSAAKAIEIDYVRIESGRVWGP